MDKKIKIALVILSSLLAGLFLPPALCIFICVIGWLIVEKGGRKSFDYVAKGQFGPKAPAVKSLLLTGKILMGMGIILGFILPLSLALFSKPFGDDEAGFWGCLLVFVIIGAPLFLLGKARVNYAKTRQHDNLTP